MDCELASRVESEGKGKNGLSALSDDKVAWKWE